MIMIAIEYIIEMISLFYMILSVDVATQTISLFFFFFFFKFSNMVIIYSLDFSLRKNKICHIPSIAYISLTLMNKGKSLVIQ